MAEASNHATAPGPAGAERHATWLELFFDLVFVAAITAVGRQLALQSSWRGIALYGALFVPIWWAWVGYTVYANRFPREDRAHRALTGLMMFAAAGMAVQLGQIPETGGYWFALAFGVARLSLLLLYARQHGPANVRLLRRLYLGGFGLGAAVWLLSLLIPPPTRYVCWGLGMTIDMATPWVGRARHQLSPLNVSHLPERMGLFTLILLGESIVEVVDSLSHEAIAAPGPFVAAFLACAIAGAIWFDYFSFVAVTHFECRLGAGQPYIYTHLLLAIGLTSLAAGIHRAIPEAAHAALTGPTLLLLGAGAALWFASFLGVQIVSNLRHARGLYAYYGAASIAALLLVTMGRSLPPVALLGGLTV
ncbi:MAG TPA: low temperature requirement protein A, partial [Stenomitos sp.]